MTDYREQAIRDVAAACGGEVVGNFTHLPESKAGERHLLFAYAVACGERVRELEAVIREAILHLDEVGWPVVKQMLEAQLQQTDSHSTGAEGV